METNVLNIPLEKMYRFDINRYIWKLKGFGQNALDEPRTAVCEVTENGLINILAYGDLVRHSEINDYNRGFGIKDSKSGNVTDFKVTFQLQEVTSEDLAEILDLVALNYCKNHK